MIAGFPFCAVFVVLPPIVISQAFADMPTENVTIKKTTARLKMGKRILVVDDEPDVCFVLETLLDENGFVVDSYQDPLLALKRFKADLYNLVMLDIRMPGLNGFALYRDIRRLDKKVKICFLTAGEMYYGYSDIFSSLPASHFIRKPIDNEGLIERINEIIANDTQVT